MLKTFPRAFRLYWQDGIMQPLQILSAAHSRKQSPVRPRPKRCSVGFRSDDRGGHWSPANSLSMSRKPVGVVEFCEAAVLWWCAGVQKVTGVVRGVRLSSVVMLVGIRCLNNGRKRSTSYVTHAMAASSPGTLASTIWISQQKLAGQRLPVFRCVALVESPIVCLCKGAKWSKTFLDPCLYVYLKVFSRLPD